MQNEGVDNNPKTLFEKRQEFHMKNLEKEKTLLELEESINNSPLLAITNPIRGECQKVTKYYMIQENRITEELRKCSSEFHSLSVQTAKLQAEIDIMQQYKLERAREDKKAWQEKSQEAESAFKTQENALRIAKNMFDVKFNMNIEIEDTTPETFVAVVYFVKDIKKPVKFIINHVQRKVIDFDASSVLSSTEEGALKKMFKGDNNVQALTIALRNKI